MKCARCGHDSTYPQRTGGVCPGCKGKFAFEPRTGDPLPDMAWKSAIDWVSSNGTVRFTAAHLHHAVARRKKPAPAGRAFFFFSFVGLIVAVAGFANRSEGGAMFGLLTAGVLLVGGLVTRSSASRGLSLDRDTFDQLFARWRQAHGDPKGLIAPRASVRPMSAAMARELEGYSFDRAVICDVPETVDVLLGNDFHFENNCAVLTAGGYPEHAAPIIRKMLRKNPRLEVFVLHDATVQGLVLAHMLRTDPAWFGGQPVKVFDVALRPAQAKKHPELAWPGEGVLVPEDHPAIGPDEVVWLRQYRMHLAALSPEQLIKRLFRAMQRLPELAASQGADGSSGSSSSDVIFWSTDASASDGGGDSFG